MTILACEPKDEYLEQNEGLCSFNSHKQELARPTMGMLNWTGESP